MNPIACTVCGEEGHPMRRCPSLASPLKDGFYSPPAGARQGGGDDSSARGQALSSISSWGGDDDEDEHIHCKIELPVNPVLGITHKRCQKRKRNSKSAKL